MTIKPYYQSDRVTLYHGDSLSVLPTLEAVDAVVTDPPYGLSFMGKRWDYDVPGVDMWAACLGALKPGGHLLAFAGTRTQHRMAVNIEDAGFDIRDMIAWVYGSGFPKSHNLDGDWKGWGTALKPAMEPITVARKPLEGTVAANVLAHGTGAINVDGCRVGSDGGTAKGSKPQGLGKGIYGAGLHGACKITQLESGRWPANLIHDGSEEAVAGFPETKSSVRVSEDKDFPGATFSLGRTGTTPRGHCDSGSAARFFYCPKASKADRESGLDSIEIVTVQCSSWENADHKARLRVDTAQSPPRVIAVSGAPCNDARAWNMLLFGSPSTVPCLLVNKSTIETATNSTTESRTLNWLVRSNTSGCTAVASCETEHGGSLAESAEFGTPSLTITSEWTVSARGVERVQSPMRLSISGNAGSPADHPTVKPTDLMRYLCRLVTPPGGVVLDPFMGSGSTGKAATLEGFRFIGIEIDERYCEIAAKRIQAAERESAERLVPA